MQKRNPKNRIGPLLTLLVFSLALLVLIPATADLASGARSEGVQATHDAIERAAVLCYATEGFYPPGLEYIEQNYGVHVDTERYVVHYEVFASNIMPIIQVLPR